MADEGILEAMKAHDGLIAREPEAANSLMKIMKKYWTLEDSETFGANPYAQYAANNEQEKQKLKDNQITAICYLQLRAVRLAMDISTETKWPIERTRAKRELLNIIRKAGIIIDCPDAKMYGKFLAPVIKELRNGTNNLMGARKYVLSAIIKHYPYGYSDYTFEQHPKDKDKNVPKLREYNYQIDAAEALVDLCRSTGDKKTLEKMLEYYDKDGRLARKKEIGHVDKDGYITSHACYLIKSGLANPLQNNEKARLKEYRIEKIWFPSPRNVRYLMEAEKNGPDPLREMALEKMKKWPRTIKFGQKYGVYPKAAFAAQLVH